MIDLHTHYLPGLDDGAKSLEETLAMAEMAWRDGIRRVVVTPHVAEGQWETTPEEIAQKMEEVQAACREQGLGLEFISGAEVLIGDDLPERVQDGRAPTLAGMGQYLLLEFPFVGLPLCTKDVIFQLRLQGVRPIIAHPERYGEFQQEPERFYRFAVDGILGQVTAQSLLGGYGPQPKRTAELFIKHRWAQIIATDTHGPTNRPPILSEAVQAAAALIGEEEARKMVTETPQRILEGRPVVVDPQEWTKKRGIFSFLSLRSVVSWSVVSWSVVSLR